MRAVAAAVGVAPATIWRFENARIPGVSVLLVARILAVVGLDLWARAYPGPDVLRDQSQVDLLQWFRNRLHSSLGWSGEVPFPNPGDQRRWDGIVRGLDWRYGVEAETGPQDAQALAGRLQLKLRDGGVDGILLVLPDTRRVRTFLAAAESLLAPLFPVPGKVALERLLAGADPGGNAIIVLRTGRRVSSGESTDA